MSSCTDKEEMIESEEELETNYPVNTKQQKPGSSAKFYGAEGQSLLEAKKEIESLKTLLKKQSKEKENDIKNLQKEAAVELETHTNGMQSLKFENLKLKNKLASCKNDARTELNKMPEKDEAINKLQNDAAAKLETHIREMQSLKSENQKLTNELASCKNDARTELNKMMTEKEETTNKLQKEAAAKLETHTKEMQSLKSENQKLTNELASCKNDAGTELNKMMTAKDEIIKKLQKEAAAKLETHTKEMQSLKSENLKLKSELASCKNDARTELNTMMTAKEEVLKKLQNDIKIQKERATSVEQRFLEMLADILH